MSDYPVNRLTNTNSAAPTRQSQLLWLALASMLLTGLILGLIGVISAPGVAIPVYGVSFLIAAALSVVALTVTIFAWAGLRIRDRVRQDLINLLLEQDSELLQRIRNHIAQVVEESTASLPSGDR
jgi:membrane protein implicated in regulation of membrane protease activity